MTYNENIFYNQLVQEHLCRTLTIVEISRTENVTCKTVYMICDVIDFFDGWQRPFPFHDILSLRHITGRG